MANRRPAIAVEPVLIGATGVATLIDASVRHVRRLNDAGAMPAPIRLGALVRWRRGEIEEWISRGCPNVRRNRGER